MASYGGHASFLLFVVQCMVTVWAGPDLSICDPQDIQNKIAALNPPVPQPKLPDYFKIRVECNIMDKNYTIDVKEFYDGPNDRGAIHMYRDGVEVKLFYSYQTDELLVVKNNDDSSKDCTVYQLSSSPYRFLLGLKKFQNNTERISSPQTTFRFGGDIPEFYNGTDVVRGINVDKWESCIYWAAQNATMKTTYYFNVKGGWENSLVEVEPVRAHVIGRTSNGTTSRDWEHIYEFTDFDDRTTNDDSEYYETDHQVYCTNRILTKEIPTITDAFSFSSEILDLEAQTFNRITEYYDFNSHLFRYDFYPDATQGTPFGTNLLTRIHDFNTGVAYTIDTVMGNCTVSTIDGGGLDAVTDGSGNVRIRTKEEFFDLDNVNYQYSGVKKVRGIDCDVFTAKRTDWPVGTNIVTYWEWSFATADWLESVGYDFEFGLPVQFRVTSFASEYNVVYNLFDYKEDTPLIWTYDISPCYSFDNRIDLQFALPGSFREIVEPNEELFKSFVLLTICGYSSVSPLRVANIRYTYINDEIIVSFTLLDKAPIAGDVQHVKEVTLKEADAILENTINRGEFIVRMDNDTFKDLAVLKAKPYSYQSTDVYLNQDKNIVSPDSPSSGYGAGAMAGVGIAMLVASFGLGVGILYVLFKIKGVSVPSLPVSFSPKRFDDSEVKTEEDA